MIINDAIPLVDVAAAKEDVSSSMADENETPTTSNTPGGNKIDVVVPVESIHAISDQFANTTYGFFLGKVAYPVVANYFRNTWGKYGLARSMFSSPIALFSFQFSSMEGLDAMLENGPCEDGLSAIATKLGTSLMLDSYTSDMCMPSWGRSSYARVMIGLRADVELKDNIVVAMPRIKGEGHYICNVRVEYEWKPPRCAACKVFGHIHEACPKNTGASEEKTLKKPCQSSRGVLVGPKIGFKPHKKYRPVPKKPNASYSGTNGGLQIWKFEDLLSSGQAILVDNAGNPLKKVKLMDEYDSEDEIESVDNDMARSLASEKGRMKHTEDTSPFPSGQCPKGNISIEKVVSEDNIADILSLPLKCESFNYFRLSLGMMEHIP
ncbi:hypothetical protein Tco_1251703 [Tanacetum coccineum]